MFGKSSDDVLLLPRRMHSRSQNSARMKKTTFFWQVHILSVYFFTFIITKIANSTWCEKPIPSEIRVRALHFRASKRNFFAFCTHKMDSFVSYFAGFLRKQIKQAKNYSFPDEFWNLQTSKDHVSLWQKRTPKNTCS